jgi:glutamate racemase
MNFRRNRPFDYRWRVHSLRRVLCGLAFGVAVVAACARVEAAPDVIAAVVEHANAHADGRAAFSFDQAALLGDLKGLPIGVFDSGVGGLTVLEAIYRLDAFNNDTLQPGPDGRRDFEQERFIYLGDQANMPYGNYAPSGRTDYLRELILKDALFLLGRRHRFAPGDEPAFDKPPVKAIVIACNTATAFGLEDLRSAVKSWNLPVIIVGVVEAGARGVTGPESGGGTTGTVAVLATVGTCSSEAYPKAIGRHVGRASLPAPRVIQQGCLGLAGAIEGDPAFVWSGNPGARAVAYQGPGAPGVSAVIEPALVGAYAFDPAGLLGDPVSPGSWQLNSSVNYVRYDVTTLVENFRRAGGGAPIDSVVLGCTHFPLVQGELRDAFRHLRDLRQPDGSRPYRDLIAPEVRFVNPAELTAAELFRALAQARLRLKPGEARALDRDVFYLSAPNPRYIGARLTPGGALDSTYKYGRHPGALGQEDTVCVLLTPSSLPPGSRQLVEGKLPEVWSRLSRPAAGKAAAK